MELKESMDKLIYEVRVKLSAEVTQWLDQSAAKIGQAVREYLETQIKMEAAKIADEVAGSQTLPKLGAANPLPAPTPSNNDPEAAIYLRIAEKCRASDDGVYRLSKAQLARDLNLEWWTIARCLRLLEKSRRISTRTVGNGQHSYTEFRLTVPKRQQPRRVVVPVRKKMLKRHTRTSTPLSERLETFLRKTSPTGQPFKISVGKIAKVFDSGKGNALRALQKLERNGVLKREILKVGGRNSETIIHPAWASKPNETFEVAAPAVES